MTELVQEHEVTCQACWETVTVTLDLSIDDQEFIEDCHVCCSPLSISVRADCGELLSVSVEAA